MRMWTAALLAGAVTLVSSCSSGYDGRVEDKAVAEPGVHRLDDFPLAQRSDAAFVWIGDRLFVWGGATVDDPSAGGSTLGYGAVLVPHKGWTALQASPYPHGLYRPVGAWDGTEVIIVGSDCDESIPPDTTGEPPRCETPAAVAWKPSTGRWRRLAVPPIPVDPESGQAVFRWGATAVGGDGAAVFVDDRSGTALGWNRGTGDWSVAAAPGDGSLITCADPTRPWIVGRAPRYGPGGEDRRLWTIRPTSDEAPSWSAEPEPEVDTDTGSCGAGHVVGNYLLRPMIIDVATGAAQTIEDPAPTVGASLPTSASLVGWWLLTAESSPVEPPATTFSAPPAATREPGPTPAPPVERSPLKRTVRLAPDGPSVPFVGRGFIDFSWARTTVVTDDGLITCELREQRTCRSWVAPMELRPPRR